MTPRFNLLSGQLAVFNKGLRVELQDLSGARSPGLLKAAQVLRTHWRRVLSSAGGGRPSAAGEAPRKQSGKLARSVKQGLTETGRRVAVTWFTAPLLEGGVDTSLAPRPNKRGRSRSRQGRYKGGNARLRIAPRPSANRALSSAQTEMTEAMVGGIQAELAAEFG